MINGIEANTYKKLVKEVKYLSKKTIDHFLENDTVFEIYDKKGNLVLRKALENDDECNLFLY